jgi:hypothetical protein
MPWYVRTPEYQTLNFNLGLGSLLTAKQQYYLGLAGVLVPMAGVGIFIAVAYFNGKKEETKDFPKEDSSIPQFRDNCAKRGGRYEELGQGNYACVLPNAIAHMDKDGKVSMSTK